jgi:hypothetical protein
MAGPSPSVSRDIRHRANTARVRNYERKRYVAGAWLVVFALAAANHYLSWGLFGLRSGPVLSATMLVLVIWLFRWGPSMREMKVHMRLKRFREDAAWREVVRRAEEQSSGQK